MAADLERLKPLHNYAMGRPEVPQVHESEVQQCHDYWWLQMSRFCPQKVSVKKKEIPVFHSVEYMSIHIFIYERRE